MPNYALDALQGFQGVNNIFRQKRADKQAEEDREDWKARLAKQDARNDEQWAWQQQDRKDQETIRAANMAEIDAFFGGEVASNPGAVKKISGFLNDPQRVGDLIAVRDELNQYLSQGKTPPQDLLAKALNLSGAEELQARGGDDGLTREVASVVPSPNKGEVMIGFNVTGKDGKTYQAPMTTGASADPNDNIVQSIPVQKAIEWVNGATATAKTIAMAKARAGDTSFMDAYRSAMAQRQNISTELATYEAKKKIDQKYAKPSAAASGLSKRTVKHNDDGSFDVYDPETNTASTVYTPQAARQIARQKAEAWATQEAEGVFNFKPKDKEIAAKEEAFYQELMGSGSVAPQFTPGQTIEQNGVRYVVDDNGVPQQQGGKKPGRGSAMAADAPNYGKRKDGTPKGVGFFGELKRPDGGVSTELSIGVNIDGKEVEIPALVPGLSAEQIESLLSGEKPSREIVNLAVKHARKRIADGKSPFAQDGEQQQKPKNPGKQRVLELDRQKKDASGQQPIIADDLKQLPGQAWQATKGAAKLGLDAYQAFVGQPFVDSIKQMLAAQGEVRTRSLLDQRYKSGAISEEEYLAGVEAINNAKS